MRVEQQNHRLIIHDGRSECWIDPWGKDSLRVRMSAEPGMDGHDWALTEPVEATDVVIRSEVIDTTDPWYKGDEWAKYHQTGTEWTLTNGKITAKISTEGWITFLNQRGEVLTAEYWRNRDSINRYCVPLRVPARELTPIPGGTDFSLTARFEAYDDEMIFGMGQYQDRHLNKKGSVLELAHRNSQSSVPFFVSSRGYGFLWNNPAIGTAAFGTNVTEWSAKSTKKLDYFITAGDRRLGCLLLAGAARAVAVRDRWIGWTAQARRENVARVVNNSRFLIFPHVRVAHLASHVLGQLARRARADWLDHWGFEPLLLETFVDPRHYAGTCYRAAGWQLLGATSGRGLARPGQSYHSTPRQVWVKPLSADCRDRLCAAPGNSQR